MVDPTLARQHVLAHLIDFTGKQDTDALAYLAANRFDGRFMKQFNQEVLEFEPVWETTVFTLAVDYYRVTGKMMTLDILHTELLRLGVTGDSLIAYRRAVDVLRTIGPLTQGSLEHAIVVLRDYWIYARWYQVTINSKDEIKQDPRLGLRRLLDNLTMIQEEVLPQEGLWDFRSRARERLERHLTLSKNPAFIGHQTGLVPLDIRLRGMAPGELMVFAGRTSVGKTLVLQHCAMKAAWYDGKQVVFASSEMGWSPEFNTLADRFEAMMTGFLHSQDLRWGSVDPSLWGGMEEWFEAFSRMKGNIVIIPPSRTITITDVVSECRRIARQQPIGLLVVDYINEIRGFSKDQYWIDKREVTRGLQLLGGELNCPVISATQISRSGYQKGDDADVGELMSESEYIAKIANIVVRISRAKGDANRLLFSVKKVREGESNWGFSTNVDWTIPKLGGHWQEEVEGLERSRRQAEWVATGATTLKIPGQPPCPVPT